MKNYEIHTIKNKTQLNYIMRYKALSQISFPQTNSLKSQESSSITTRFTRNSSNAINSGTGIHRHRAEIRGTKTLDIFKCSLQMALKSSNLSFSLCVCGEVELKRRGERKAWERRKGSDRRMGREERS
eukprot:TRINITY_DN9671_c0_g2_i1.p1 TRINITY_DN9671_c0_g2~~TRINITY_DN9671_c0_g2_i1.p1  ORF type:complete len:128 (+),score=10.67 TRINITY_DN9671_c0_g2_i1:135-518(+)